MKCDHLAYDTCTGPPKDSRIGKPICLDCGEVVLLSRLQVYDQLRRMHRLLKDIPDREDEWESNILETAAGVLYMAESEFCRERTENAPTPLLPEGKQE